jgi:thioredoxin reductase (NADPH)
MSVQIIVYGTVWCPGLFAAGDVRAGSTKQAASAAGGGATAALNIRKHLKKAG